MLRNFSDQQQVEVVNKSATNDALITTRLSRESKSDLFHSPLSIFFHVFVSAELHVMFCIVYN